MVLRVRLLFQVSNIVLNGLKFRMSDIALPVGDHQGFFVKCQCKFLIAFM